MSQFSIYKYTSTTVYLSPDRSMRFRGSRFSIAGRLTAICEPFTNGPDDFIVIVRVASITDDSQFCHIIVKVYWLNRQCKECYYNFVYNIVSDCTVSRSVAPSVASSSNSEAV